VLDYPHFFEGSQHHKNKQANAKDSSPHPVQLPPALRKPVAEYFDSGK
jgi:hypothetical protein